MDVSATINAQIRHLYDSVGVDDEETETWAGAVAHDLELAVPAYLGLQLILVDHGHSVILTEFDPAARLADVQASIRLPLRALGVPGADPASSVAFFASTPGAFVDLAADLAYALHIPSRPLGDDASEEVVHRTDITVDDPVQPSTVMSGLVGAAEVSTINRAVGLLMGEGHHTPESAHTELGRLAAAAGVPVLAFATQLVRPSAR